MKVEMTNRDNILLRFCLNEVMSANVSLASDLIDAKELDAAIKCLHRAHACSKLWDVLMEAYYDSMED